MKNANSMRFLYFLLCTWECKASVAWTSLCELLNLPIFEIKTMFLFFIFASQYGGCVLWDMRLERYHFQFWSDDLNVYIAINFTYPRRFPATLPIRIVKTLNSTPRPMIITWIISPPKWIFSFSKPFQTNSSWFFALFFDPMIVENKSHSISIELWFVCASAWAFSSKYISLFSFHTFSDQTGCWFTAYCAYISSEK